MSARSTAARSSTWASNWISIGAATPTVRPSPMFTTPRTSFCGATVANVPSSGTALPFSPVAVPDHV